MANPHDAARAETRGLLVTLRDALGQPPLSAKLQRAVDQVLDLLAEQDLDKRAAARDRLDAMLSELDGRLEP